MIKIKKICFAILILLLLAAAVMLFLFQRGGIGISRNTENSPQANNSGENAAGTAQEDSLNEVSYVENILSEMTLDEKIYQMMFVTPESITGVGQVIQAGEGTKTALRKYPVGGLIYFSPNLQSREQIINMISNSQEYSKIPLFIGVDEEGGRVTRLDSAGITKQPAMKTIGESGEPQLAYQVGAELADDLSKLGFNVDFAPVADILLNESNTVIGDRAFGSDANTVSEMVVQEVRGLQENGVSAALKHFPGHGSTYTDSHEGYSSSDRTMEELRSAEFLPFKAGIDAGVDFVMVAHITMVNAIREKVPATLSKELITECLKDELGFEGIVITDSCHMGAITDHYTSGQMAVEAVSAGIDMILMPSDVFAAHSAVKKAVNDGEISEERINESVRKILMTKAKRDILKA